jgi:hypothetical protein
VLLLNVFIVVVISLSTESGNFWIHPHTRTDLEFKRGEVFITGSSAIPSSHNVWFTCEKIFSEKLYLKSKDLAMKEPTLTNCFVNPSNKI